MTKDDMVLLSQLRAAINNKELSGEYEIIDDTITAGALDVKSDAMLSEVNEHLLQRFSPETYGDLPARAKLLLKQLNQYYVKLYADINTYADPDKFTIFMRMLKKILPATALAGLTSGAVTYMLKQSAPHAIYALLGWVIGGTLIGSTYTTMANLEEQLPEEAYKTLMKIRQVENELKRYGITFKPMIAKIPVLN